MKMKNLNKYIDHTLLKPNAIREDIKQLCYEAQKFEFASVCVNPYWVRTCHEILKDTDVMVCTVIGFPLGATSSKSKAEETRQAIEDGAKELDMVINIGLLKANEYKLVVDDIKAVVAAADGKLVKVIIETCLLSDQEIILACKAAMEAKANFVKTSTGFSTGGATIEAVKLMKETVGDQLQVKASGGIRTNDDMIAMIKAGATRIGTSSGIKLIQNEEVEGNY
ncbi:MAG: deoxyribose-phosphate aldolase [Erysipelotrichaceae bacterium]|nr:deoxyribose-phosphate aldolase [Erysipelotrichaceae bacterium]MDD4642132.1 deoxyribose-phosphate aldolase [Erysipelotrichaceae bacterium]